MTDVKRLVNMSIDIDVNSTDSLKNEEFSESICEICVIDKQNRTSSQKPHIKVIKVVLWICIEWIIWMYFN